MAEIIWSVPAMNDLIVIHDFIAKESPFFAQRTIESFFERVRLPEKFPKSVFYD